MKIWSKSIKGRKPLNEDYILHNNMGSGRYLFLIADGMGGYEDGASTAELISINISVFLENQKIVNEHVIQVAINKANLILRQIQERRHVKSGATIGGVFIDKGSALIFWVGDVKIYYLEKQIIQFESNEHSLISQLKSKGLIIDPDKAFLWRHIVTNSVQGDVKNSNAGFHKVPKIGDDSVFVICSDGFHLSHFADMELPKEIHEKVEQIFVKDDGRIDDSSIIICSFS